MIGGTGSISDITSKLDVVSQRVASLSGDSIATTDATTTTGDLAQMLGIPQPGGQVQKRVMANATSFTPLNQLPTSLNNTDPVTSPIGSGNLTVPIGGRRVGARTELTSPSLNSR
jgi:hypothetical protein